MPAKSRVPIFLTHRRGNLLKLPASAVAGFPHPETAIHPIVTAGNNGKGATT